MLYRQFRDGEIRVLVVSKVANFSINLPDANVAIQVSGTFGSRQEEAQRLARIVGKEVVVGGLNGIVFAILMGLIAVFGRSGLVNVALRWVGLAEISIYGLHGVVLAHVFFNLPLATRLILQGWQDIPAERFRLAAQLGFGPRDIFRTLERPMLARVLPGAGAVIFAICLSSFAVALTLGGGPRATTVELAIYQAFRFDFDLGRAALLASVQIALVGMAALIALPLALGSGQWINPFIPYGVAEWALIASSLIHVLVYAGYVWLVGRAGPVFAVQVSYLVTGFGVIWSLIVLNESYSPYIWMALALMFAGLFLVQPRPKAILAPAKPMGDNGL